MLLWTYKIISYLVYPFVPIYLSNRLSLKKELKERINERYGYSNISRKKGKLVWIHAASIGESISILPVIKELEKNNQWKKNDKTTRKEKNRQQSCTCK